MTIKILKAQSNSFALNNCLDRSIYASRTYKFYFISDTTLSSQNLALTPTITDNVFEFTLVEGTDIDFDLVGFYTWKLYEVYSGSENLLCQGKMKVSETRTEPTTPSTLNTQTYVVANAGL